MIFDKENNTVKFKIREFYPTVNQSSSHSFYAEAVIDNEVTNKGLAKKIAEKTGMKIYEAQIMLATIADVIVEEIFENKRVSLEDEDGNKIVSIYPKANGSVSDLDITRETTKAHEKDSSVEIRTVAQKSDLTASRLVWTLGASVGRKLSKRFTLNKQTENIDVESTDESV